MKQKRKRAIETGRKMFVQHLRALDGVWDERYDQNALSLYVKVSKTSINLKYYIKNKELASR